MAEINWPHMLALFCVLISLYHVYLVKFIFSDGQWKYGKRELVFETRELALRKNTFLYIRSKTAFRWAKEELHIP